MSGDDLAQLVDDLAHLHRALGATYALDRAYTRSTPAALVGATLAPTATRGDGRRGVPGSRPPVDLEALACQEAIRTRLLEMARTMRIELGDRTRDQKPALAAQALVRHLDRLPEGSGLRRRVPAVLDALRRRARYLLDLDRRWLVLGPCPEIHQDVVPVAWDRDGATPVAYVEVRECVTYDVLASLDATRHRADRQDADWRAGDGGPHPALPAGPVEVWRRSHIRIDRDADLTTAPASCPGCGRVWDAAERRRLGQIIEREAAERLMTERAS